MQIIAKLTGKAELPWEGPEAKPALAKLGALRAAVLRLLERDPAQRATARQFHSSCSKAFADGAAPAV